MKEERPTLPGSIGERLRKARKFHGYTLKELERASGYSASVIGYYEVGKYKPKAPVIKALAEVYGIDPNDLIGWDSRRAEAKERRIGRA